MRDRLSKHFPFFEASLIDALITHCEWAEIPSGQIILGKGAYVKVVPLLISGLLKVIRREEHASLLLYYIKPGESCVMSLTACLHNKQSQIEARTEEDTELLLLPAHLVSQWMIDFPSWNTYVYDLFNLRYSELLITIDSLIFHSMDQRIKDFLKEKSVLSGNHILKITHLEIANQLNTAREVVSRILKKLETEKFIEQSRGKIIILN